MSESLEDLKAIIDNAPEGKTHALNDDGIVTYWSDDDIGCLAISGDSVSLSGMRSLSDIKLIIELMGQVKASYEAYSRIESVKQQYNAENKQMKELLKDITENEDLDDCRFLLVDKILKGNGG